MAELESDRISERLEDFQIRRKEEGIYCGPPPFGYRVEKGKGLVVEPAQAEVVKRMYAESNSAVYAVDC